MGSGEGVGEGMGSAMGVGHSILYICMAFVYCKALLNSYLPSLDE